MIAGSGTETIKPALLRLLSYANEHGAIHTFSPTKQQTREKSLYILVCQDAVEMPFEFVGQKV